MDAGCERGGAGIPPGPSPSSVHLNWLREVGGGGGGTKLGSALAHHSAPMQCRPLLCTRCACVCMCRACLRHSGGGGGGRGGGARKRHLLLGAGQAGPGGLAPGWPLHPQRRLHGHRGGCLRFGQWCVRAGDRVLACRPAPVLPARSLPAAPPWVVGFARSLPRTTLVWWNACATTGTQA
jgi:hypothetical protein